MELSLKAVRFVIEALEHYQALQNNRLSQADLSEDDESDLSNDLLYLESIKKDFERYQDELTRQREKVNAKA